MRKLGAWHPSHTPGGSVPFVTHDHPFVFWALSPGCSTEHPPGGCACFAVREEVRGESGICAS